MASANWAAGRELQRMIPHTYTAMEHLVMAMADAYNNRGKQSIFGYDRGLKSYAKFEAKLKDALLAMTLDGLVERSAPAERYRHALREVLASWDEIFPNWPDAHLFALEKLGDRSAGNKLISSLIGVRS